MSQQNLIVKKIRQDLEKRTLRQIAGSLRLRSHATVHKWINGGKISEENLAVAMRYYK